MMSGVLEANDEAEAARQLGEMGLSEVAVSRSPARVGRPIGSDDFLFFNEQLASLAHSGICLDEGLRQLARDIDSPRLKRTIEQIATDLQSGQPLDQALSRHSAMLPGRYSRVVHAGLASGQLAPTLLNLSSHLRLMAQTRQLVARTLTYPAIVLVVACLIFMLVIWYVVPQFETIFHDFEVDLPPITKAFMALGRAAPSIAVGGGAVVIVGLMMWFGSGLSAGGRAAREMLLLSLPLIGTLMRDSLRARFLRALAYGVGSGMPLPESIRLGADATGSAWAARDAEAVARRVEAGDSSQVACEHSRVVPALVGYSVQVGGDREDTQRALSRLAQAYAVRATQTQMRIQTWLMPALVVFMGVFIGLLIVAIFLPLMNLIESVSG